MSRSVKRPRAYDSSRRKEQARQNRLAILEAARRRFLEQGFAATTMNEIATDAGVSVESVYKTFGNKSGLLKPIFDISVAGDDEPIPIGQRSDIQELIEEPDPARKLELYAAHLTRTLPRAAPVTLMIRDAAGAEPAAGEVFEQTRREFLEGMTMFAKTLHATGRIRTDLKTTRDILWTVNSVEVYELLVIERKWSLKRYALFIASTLKSALLG